MKFHVVLTESDGDIIRFMRALPEGKFNETVIKILRNAVRGKVAELPIELDDLPAAPKDLHIDLPEDLVRKCESELGFKRGKFTTGVKKEILRCIYKNYKAPPQRCVPVSQVEAVFEKANEFIANQKKKTANAPNKGAQMLDAYHYLIDWLVQNTEKVVERS
ncbi:MAG: hypothetical protein IJE62_05900 [Clostridia bacterium]|nr:hypothetical protein [Clostridia bacterium]